jgi:hypothetical protein
LRVIWRKHFLSRHVFVELDAGVNVNHLPVPLVAEEQPGLSTARVNLEIGTVVGGAHSRFPVVVAQISRLWQQFHFSLKNGSEIFSLESMRIVDVARNLLLLAWNLHPQEDDGEPPPVEHLFLPFGKQVEEGVVFPIGDGGSQRLGFIFGEVELGLFDGPLLGDKLLPRQYFSFGVIALAHWMRTSSLSCLASSISPRYMRSSLVMWESRYSS